MTRPPDQTSHTPARFGGGVVPVWTPDDFMALWEAVNKVDPADRAVVIDIHTRERIMTCPVCRRRVLPTRRDSIARHRDTAGHICPASGQPTHITKEEA